MPKKLLTPEQQRYVVTRLACYNLPRQVREDLDEEHGVLLSVNAILHYDPTKYQGHDLSKELRELFVATRRMYEEKTATVPIGNKMYRLTMLQNLADRAMDKDDMRLALAALAQAAREMGGCYERSRPASRTMNAPSDEGATVFTREQFPTTASPRPRAEKQDEVNEQVANSVEVTDETTIPYENAAPSPACSYQHPTIDANHHLSEEEGRMRFGDELSCSINLGGG